MALMDEIEAARRRLGVTQEAVASRADRHESTYSKALSGGIRPSPATLKAFWEALEAIEAEQELAAARIAKIGKSEAQQRRVA